MSSHDPLLLQHGAEDTSEVKPTHAYTFPYFHNNLYDNDTSDATSQTHLMSRSSTPSIVPPSIEQDHEMESLLERQDRVVHPRFHEELYEESSRVQEEEPKEEEQNVSHAYSFVTWGVSLRQPIIMVAFCLLGILTAISHHLYYRGLVGSIAGNTKKQQLVIWVGTGLNNMTLFLLNSANGISLTQAIWFTVKRHALSVAALDNLFGLFTDITGFVNFELLRRGKLAILIAFVFWSMVLSAVIPPGTISVVPSLEPTVTSDSTYFPDFNWTSARGSDHGLLQYRTLGGIAIAHPPPAALRVASQIALDMNVNPPAYILINSSYTQQIFGPALQCSAANPTQQAQFDFYNEASFNETGTMTFSQFLKINPQRGTRPYLQFFSAFSPQLFGYINDVYPPQEAQDDYHNWNALLGPNNTSNYSIDNGVELWIQLPDSSIVCTLTNASISLTFEALNGSTSVTQNSVTHLNKWTKDSTTDNYIGLMASVANMLYGNVTMVSYQCDIGDWEQGDCYILSRSSSQVLQTGISGCDEFVNSAWATNIDKLSAVYNTPPINFDTDSWMCRNRTVAKAIEDLAVNVTIGMLGLDIENFHPVFASTNTTLFSYSNVYEYDHEKLLLSYGAGVIATILVTALGLVLFQINGISHDASFSAIMTTTRNDDLDRLSVGQSLSAIGEDLEQTKLKFGGNRVRWEQGGREGIQRAAFGLDGKVEMLRRNEKYI